MTGEAARRIVPALYPVEAPPAGAPWNRVELDGLLPDGASLRPAAVMVGIVPRGEEDTVLLTVRNDALRHHGGQVSFPGGRLEPGDDGPLAAALREAHEEVGIAPGQVRPLGWLDPLATITGFRVLPLVALLDADIAPVADPGEVAGVFEVPFAHLLARANLRELAVTYRGRARHVLEYAPYADGEPRIWGATASILRNLMDRMDAVAAAPDAARR